MNNLNPGDIVATLDIGSSAIRVIIASYNNEKLEINYFNETKTQNIINGEINDSNIFTNEIKQLLNKRKIYSAAISINSLSIIGSNDNAPTPVSKRVTKNNISNAIDSKASSQYNDQYKEHYPNHFILDNTLVKRPIGIEAKHMVVNYHLLRVDNEFINKTRTSVEDYNDLTINRLNIGLIGSSYFLLTPEQRQQGVCLIDIGHHLVKFIIVKNNEMIYNRAFSLEKYNIEAKIMESYNCSYEEARGLLIGHGFIDNIIKEDEYVASFFDIDNNEKYFSNYDLSLIITAQYRKIFNKIKEIIKPEFNIKDLNAGILLTGGRVKIKNIRQLAVNIFNSSVRRVDFHESFLAERNIVCNDKNFNMHKYANALSAITYQNYNDYLTANNTQVASRKGKSSLFRKIKSLVDNID